METNPNQTALSAIKIAISRNKQTLKRLAAKIETAYNNKEAYPVKLIALRKLHTSRVEEFESAKEHFQKQLNTIP